MTQSPIDLSAVVVCRDDEEQVGHTIRRVAAHARSLGLRAEIFAVDEGSSDNTLPLLHLLRREIPELQIVCGAADGRGYFRGAALARGRALLLIDARSRSPLSALGWSLAQLVGGRRDCVAVGGRYLVLHRVRSLRAHDALIHPRHARGSTIDLERRFMRRAHALGLSVNVAAARPRPSGWSRLRDAILAPVSTIASRF